MKNKTAIIEEVIRDINDMANKHERTASLAEDMQTFVNECKARYKNTGIFTYRAMEAVLHSSFVVGIMTKG